MKTTIDTYPVFDANQVLTNDHLNMLVNYLDEQQRLTRANLVGIGISCGLDLTLDKASSWAGISKGCAVTSHGYLLIEHDDVELTGYRAYALPEGDAYGPFMNGTDQLPLWELFPDGEPNVTKLGSPADFLKNKSVLLFLERNNEDLSDCSPSNCDDKGSEVTVTLRRLLVDNSSLAQIIEKIGKETDDSARLQLPDLRLQRYDTPRTGPVTTRDILEAFQTAVKKDHLVTAVEDALVAAYDAFKPVLLKAHPSNPFDGFMFLYGFLESVPVTPRQVAFMPYYMDLFSDLLAAYEEFRKRGLVYSCLCCPPEGWFQRHVVLGPAQRTGWHPSTASGCGCEGVRREMVLLFTRLVEITRRFGNTPALRERRFGNNPAPLGRPFGNNPAPLERPFASNPALGNSSLLAAIDEQIRVTPSRAGTAPLSTRCIPYYYDFTGRPPLYELWNPALTGQGRAHHNQGYRCNEYSPDPPAFVNAPLSFDLEPFDFFRIEGHLGKDYRAVVARLKEIRDSFRLPFDVVAVRTGRVGEPVDLDPAEHACRFQDLEAAYKILREELVCLASKSMVSLGSIKPKRPVGPVSKPFTMVPRSRALGASIPFTRSTLAKSTSLADVVRQLPVQPGTIGAAVFDSIKAHGFQDLTLVGESAVVNAALSVLNKLARLTSLLAQDLYSVDWVEFESVVEQLKRVSDSIGQEGAEDATEGGLTWQELNRQIVSVAYTCRLEGFLVIRDEYLRRLESIRNLAYFDGYVKDHPAIQHKAGVPVGGTFVVVYHGGPASEPKRDDVYASAIAQLAPGAVIADFCLPYQCCSDCAPIQFVLGGLEAPTVEAPEVDVRLGCTNADSRAEVEIMAKGGMSPYALSVDGEARGSFPATISFALAAGTHTLQVADADAVAGAPVTLVVPATLTTGDVVYVDDSSAGTFTASFNLKGGTPPYSASTGRVDGDLVSLGTLQSGTALEVVITDAAGCSTKADIRHEVEPVCTKPCGGKASRARYPVWAPRPAATTPYRCEVRRWNLEVTDERGATIYSANLAELVGAIVKAGVTEERYAEMMTRICREVSAAVDAVLIPGYGAGAFSIGYDSKAGTLLIEAYSCHTFRIEIEFALSGENVARSERWSYAREGIRVEQRAISGAVSSYSMPAFGRIELDKCTNETGKDCAVDLRSIISKPSGSGLFLTPAFGEGVDRGGLQFHWRVDGPSLLYSNESAVRLRFDNASAVQAQLLVIDRKGCWGFADTWITPVRRAPVRSPRRRR